ncbi:MAG: phosphatase PAP2 family protein [Dysgonamonadaceae bacterium]
MANLLETNPTKTHQQRFIFLKTSLLLLLASLTCSQLIAQSKDNIKVSTDILMFATPAAGLIATICEKDYEGAKQLFFSGATSIAASYLLKYSIKKNRPDGTDKHAFPSNHTAMAFQGASFIGLRYGWKYTVPAYLLSGYIAWGRIYSRRHDVWDVTAGAIIGTASSFLFTHSFARRHKFQLTPSIDTHGRFGFYASAVF